MTETLLRPDNDEQSTDSRDLGAVEQESLPADIQEYVVPEDLNVELAGYGLPQGYGLSGGAARDIALATLTGDRLPVRDIDVIAFRDRQADVSPGLLRDTSTRLMPDDYAHGHGVRVESLEHYFGTRDFTINEVTAVDGRVLLTAAAQEALRDGIIRPTKFECDEEENRRLNPRLAVKAVLLQSVLQAEGLPARLEGFDPSEYQFRTTTGYDPNKNDPFFVALGFQKALEYSPTVARDFLDHLVGYGMVDSMAHGNGHLAAFAQDLAAATYRFEFRGEAAKILDAYKTVSIGDMLEALSPDVMDDYDRHHETAQAFGGQGRQYTDERRY